MASELGRRLAALGAEVLVETLRRLEAGTITPRKQNEAEATLAPMLKKEDGRVEWTRSARSIFNQVRGFDPWPGAYTSFRGDLLHLRRVRPVEGPAGEPGELRIEGRTLRAACGEGWLELLEVQPEGKRRMSGQEFASGRRLAGGERLG